jgi:hypothetical protein
MPIEAQNTINRINVELIALLLRNQLCIAGCSKWGNKNIINLSL